MWVPSNKGQQREDVGAQHRNAFTQSQRIPDRKYLPPLILDGASWISVRREGRVSNVLLSRARRAGESTAVTVPSRAGDPPSRDHTARTHHARGTVARRSSWPTADPPALGNPGRFPEETPEALSVLQIGKETQSAMSRLSRGVSDTGRNGGRPHPSPKSPSREGDRSRQTEKSKLVLLSEGGASGMPVGRKGDASSTRRPGFEASAGVTRTGKWAIHHHRLSSVRMRGSLLSDLRSRGRLRAITAVRFTGHVPRVHGQRAPTITHWLSEWERW